MGTKDECGVPATLFALSPFGKVRVRTECIQEATRLSFVFTSW